MTRMHPAWLRLTDKKQFKPIREASWTIRHIFKLKLNDMGAGRIAEHLDKTSPWTPHFRKKQKSFGWRPSYIKKMLTNRAVIGAYQPHRKIEGKRVPVGDPIPNYYPQVVKQEVFHAVQESMNGNRGKGGQTGKASNLFVHLVKCAYCGGPMHFVDKGSTWQYLVCNNGKRGVKCKPRSIRYDECEKVILENCHKLQPDQVLPQKDEQAKLCQSLRRRLAGLTGTINDIDQQLANYTDQIGRTNNQTIRDRYEAKIVELEAQKTEAEKQLQQTTQELNQSERGLQSFKQWQNDLQSLRQALATNDAALRIRLRGHLREFIDKIEVFTDGHRKLYDSEDRDGDNFREYMDAVLDQSFQGRIPKARRREHNQFVEGVLQRRMSRAGRFLRLRFKGGARMDVVPEKSIASGMELMHIGRVNGHRFKSPDIDHLARKRKRLRKPK